MKAWLISLLAALAFWAAPARADDISAAARGVVRVVTIAFSGNEVVGFGHGSGFAVAPNRIVTNAHVVELAARYPHNVLIGIVPSEGSKSFEGRVIGYDPARDLALIEFDGTRLSPLTLYAGPVNDGETVDALGYPGNVDLATARSAADYITPLSPVRSEGAFAGRRSLTGTEVLLHTAAIARGNSGGPLLDRCGRVIGVNSAVTRTEQGDATFGFAIADSALAAFLREAGQPFRSVGSACTSIEQRLAEDEAASAHDRDSADAVARAEAVRAALAQEAALADARADEERSAENFMGVAALLLVAGGLAIGGAGLIAVRGSRKPAIGVAAGGGVLLLAAIVVFVLRPDGKIDMRPMPGPTDQAAKSAPVALGAMTCRFVPARSRVTVSATDDVPFDWRAGGCVNGRTQYVASNGDWERILVPAEEETVSVLDFDPAARTYVNTRYLLSAAEMEKLRALRGAGDLKACTADREALARLAAQQAAIRAALPNLPNEKLVYQCATDDEGEDG